jgi:hypothetical protein
VPGLKVQQRALARRGERTHEPGGVGLVGADLVVDLDEALLDDERNLTAGQGVLEAVADEDLKEGKRARGVSHAAPIST